MSARQRLRTLASRRTVPCRRVDPIHTSRGFPPAQEAAAAADFRRGSQAAAEIVSYSFSCARGLAQLDPDASRPEDPTSERRVRERLLPPSCRHNRLFARLTPMLPIGWSGCGIRRLPVESTACGASRGRTDSTEMLVWLPQRGVAYRAITASFSRYSMYRYVSS